MLNTKKTLAAVLCSTLLSAGVPLVQTPVTFAATKQEKIDAKQMYQDGFAAYRNNNLVQAADLFMTATKLDDSNPIYAMSAGDLLRRLKQYTSSIRYYEAAVDKLGNSPKGMKKKITTQTLSGLAQSYLGAKKYPEAERVAQQLADEYEKDWLGYFILAKVADEQKNYDVAIQRYEKAIEVGPTELDPYLSLAALYKKQNDKEGMAKAYSRGADMLPLDKNMKISLARVYLDPEHKSKYADKAEAVMKDLINLDPNSAFGHYYLGLAYALQGKFTDAINEVQMLGTINNNLAMRLQNDIQSARNTGIVEIPAEDQEVATEVFDTMSNKEIASQKDEKQAVDSGKKNNGRLSLPKLPKLKNPSGSLTNGDPIR